MGSTFTSGSTQIMAVIRRERVRRLVSRIAGVSCALIAGLVCGCDSASAALTHEFVSSFGSFANVQGVAVDSSSGDVYVFDAGAGGGSLFKFDSTGTPAKFPGLPGEPSVIEGVGGAGEGEDEIAVDNSASGPAKGDIYVAQGSVVKIFSSDGNALGELTEEAGRPWGKPCGVAVDTAGHVYVGLAATEAHPASTVNRYAPAANPVVDADYSSSLWKVNNVCNVAVDGAGSVYADTFSEGPVTEFEALQFSAVEIEASGSQVSETGRAIAIDTAADPTTKSENDVYVARSGEVAQYEPTGALIDAFNGLEAHPFGNSHGVAVNSASGRVYVSDNEHAHVDVFSPTVVIPEVTTEAATSVSTGAATLHGTVNPAEVAVTGCRFEYGTSTAYGHSAECEQSPGSGNTPVAVTANIESLQPNASYHYRLVASNANGSNGGADAILTTLSPPLIETGQPSNVLVSTATLNAKIDPLGFDTTYRFEYGPDTSYGTSIPVPDARIGSGLEYVGVSRQLTGLQPAGIYHYRVVATNANGTTVGADQTLTTLPITPPPASEHCENEALRTGPSATLPDCRAYEQVTPTNKSSASADIVEEGGNVGASVDGNRVALQTLATLGPTPDVAGSLSVFSRTAAGWAITSVPPPDAGAEFYIPQIFSPDLTHVGFYSWFNLPNSKLSSDTFQIGSPGGPYSTVATTPPDEGPLYPTGDSRLFGASQDFSHVVLATIDHTLLSSEPTGTDERAYDLYELVNGQLRLVNVTGEGSQAHVIGKCGAMLGGGELFSQAGVFTQRLAHNAVSSDGSKIFFTAPDIFGEGEGCYKEPLTGESLRSLRAPNATQIYMRVSEMPGGREVSRTVEVSAPSPEVDATLSPAEKIELEERPAFYQAATPDGSKVFFVAEGALTSDAENGDFHLYEYDTQAREGQRLKLIFQTSVATSGDPRFPTVFPSQNGSVVYFYMQPIAGRNSELYRYEAAGGGSLHAIASVAEPRADEAPRVTPDGEFFMFVSEGNHGQQGVAGEPRGAGHNEFYRYSHADGSVMCVSCGPADAPPEGNTFEGTAPGPGHGLAQLEGPNETPERIVMSDDGSEVFFDSTANLVPGVVNAHEASGLENEGQSVTDVYEWEADGAGGCIQRAGCTFVITQGNNATKSFLVGSSADGSNVFFITQASLVAQDVDSSDDIYDARVGGGFPAPAQPTACLGDTCQSVPAAVNDPTPSTLSFSGPGNPISPIVAPPGKEKGKGKKCGRGKVRRRGKCVKHKVRRAARRAVKHNHGGSR